MAPVASYLWEVCFKNLHLVKYASKCCLSLGVYLLISIRAHYLFREESVLQDIQPDKLHAKMQDPNFSEEAQLVDVREPEEVYAHF